MRAAAASMVEESRREGMRAAMRESQRLVVAVAKREALSKAASSRLASGFIYASSAIFFELRP